MNASAEGLADHFHLEVNSHQITPADHEQYIAQALLAIDKSHQITVEEILLGFNEVQAQCPYIDLYDYIKLNLWNPDYIGDGDKNSYIGEQAQIKYTFKMYYNLNVDGYHITLNKVASQGYFAAMSLPVIPVKTIYLPSFIGGDPVLHSEAALSAFLADEDNYPMFGKPVRYAQSLGSAGLKSVRDNTITTLTNQTMSIDSYVEEITRYFNEDGYLFQPLRTNHPKLHPLIGPMLATIRVMTLATPAGYKLFRAAWKIPAQANFADNYWRPGNLIAGIDVNTGTITHVVSGSGTELKEWTHHPETGALLVGYQIPDWQSVLNLALRGARLFPRLPIMGWDLALSCHGLVIVEANDLPDFGIIQLADKCGVLTGQGSDELKQILAQYEE